MKNANYWQTRLGKSNRKWRREQKGNMALITGRHKRQTFLFKIGEKSSKQFQLAAERNPMYYADTQYCWKQYAEGL